MNAVLGSLKEVRPAGWATTEAFQAYLAKTDVEATAWTGPDLNYYLSLVNRMVDSILFRKYLKKVLLVLIGNSLLCLVKIKSIQTVSKFYAYLDCS